MPVTVWQTSPLENVFLNIGADVGFPAAQQGFVSIIMHEGSYDFGSISKSLVDGLVYVMFEINEPQGTVFASAKLEFTVPLTAGSGDLDFWLGLLAKDGFWNATTESTTRGIGSYLLTGDLPKPSAQVDALWASGETSISDVLTVAFPSGGIPGRGSFGSVGSGADIEDAQFLTDLQAAFDANESDRTVARGVPLMFFMRQSQSPVRSFRFVSQNAIAEVDRPTLTLNVSDIVTPAFEFTVDRVAATVVVDRSTEAGCVGRASSSTTVKVPAASVAAERAAATISVARQSPSVAIETKE